MARICRPSGLAQPTQLHQLGGIAMEGIREVGPKRDRGLIIRKRFAEAAEFLQRIGPVVVGFGSTRIKRDRTVVACDSAIRVFQLLENRTTIVVRLGILGLECNGLVKACQ